MARLECDRLPIHTTPSFKEQDILVRQPHTLLKTKRDKTRINELRIPLLQISTPSWRNLSTHAFQPLPIPATKSTQAILCVKKNCGVKERRNDSTWPKWQQFFVRRSPSRSPPIGQAASQAKRIQPTNQIDLPVDRIGQKLLLRSW